MTDVVDHSLERAIAVLRNIDLTQRRFALVTRDKMYRYWLHRSWFTGTGWTVFIMLNPSTADALLDDPTVRRCVGFAKAWGTQGVVIVNLYAGRSTQPSYLYTMDDPVGPENDLFVRAALRLSSRPVCAWGAYGLARRRKHEVLDMIHRSEITPMCLGLTKNNSPQHPLYIPSNIDPVPYNG